MLFGMDIEWNKVTRYSQALAIVLFVGTFFLGFWLGTMNSKETNVPINSPEFVNNTTEKGDTDISSKEIQIQTVKLSSDKIYRIISPKAGGAFYEDDPITVEWEGPNNFQSLSFYLLPSNCSDELCDDEFQREFPLRTNIGFSKESAGTSTLSLRDNSPNVAYPEGEYRIAMRSSHEGPQPILAVSEPFTILPPRDKSRDFWTGDRLGDFTITGLSVYTLDTIGTTTVSGSAYVDEMFGIPCFDVTEEDYKKLPRPESDGRYGWFCFNNDIPQELLGIEGTTTIQIANYYVDGRPMAVADRADFVKIVR
jgi:hypothetical protein